MNTWNSKQIFLAATVCCVSAQGANGLSFKMFGLSLESQVLMIEDPEARSSCENIFVFRKNNVVQSHTRSEMRTVDQCLRMRCGVL